MKTSKGRSSALYFFRQRSPPPLTYPFSNRNRQPAPLKRAGALKYDICAHFLT